MSIRLFFLAILFGGILSSAQAQEWQFGVGYRYHYAPEWDKAIRTYNFSRPFLDENQPLLVSGSYLEANYRFKSRKKLSSGIQIAHGFVRSRAGSDGFENAIRWHSLQVNYVLRYQTTDKFSFDLEAGVIGGLLSRRFNGEIYEVDGEALKAMGGSGMLGVNMNYAISLSDRSSLMPFMGMGFTPYYYAPKTEEVLNQTRGLSGEDYTVLLTVKLGAKWSFGKAPATE